MTDAPTNELKPCLKACPFCGGKELLSPNELTQVHCLECEASGPMAWGEKHSAAWNRRAPSPALEAMRKALEELYAQVKGECPSLLNEDSGGDGELDLEIEEAIRLAEEESPRETPRIQS